MASHTHRHHRYFSLRGIVTVRLFPDPDSRLHSWTFVLPSGQAGMQLGSLFSAARGVLRLAHLNGHPGVDLVIPRAGLWGVFPRRFRLTVPGDERQLASVDVEGLRRRMAQARPWWSGWTPCWPAVP